jgi:ATP-binding cassette subfamily F protein uup
VLTLEAVRKSFGPVPVISSLDLTIGPGTRLGIVGPNGSGKTTFLKLCMGLVEPDSGRVLRGSTVRFAAIDQSRAELDPEHTVLEEVAGKNDYVKVGGRMLHIESFLEQFLFSGDMKHIRIGDLSGGERNRVLLAKLLCAGGNVIVLDEPTNDLDLMALRVLEEALLSFPGTVLVVSHDRFFLDRVATRILHLDGQGRARVHEGDLSALLEKLAAERAAESRPKAARPAVAEKPRRRRLSIPEQRELEALPGRIEAAETEMARLDALLADPALWAKGGGEARALGKAREDAAALVERMMERWEELERIKEAAG